MIIYVDIDNTICYTNGNDYINSQPNYTNIKKINKLHAEGHTIVYWTARGTMTNSCHFKLTQIQLDTWDVKYHEIRMGKPSYDLFIDDKNLNSQLHFTQSNINKILHKK
jgi:hypothetical protein